MKVKGALGIFLDQIFKTREEYYISRKIIVKPCRDVLKEVPQHTGKKCLLVLLFSISLVTFSQSLKGILLCSINLVKCKQSAFCTSNLLSFHTRNKRVEDRCEEKDNVGHSDVG